VTCYNDRNNGIRHDETRRPRSCRAPRAACSMAVHRRRGGDARSLWQVRQFPAANTARFAGLQGRAGNEI